MSPFKWRWPKANAAEKFKGKQLREKRNFLIDPEFQIKLITYFIVLHMVITAIYFTANIYFFNHFEQIGIDNGLRADHIFFKLVQNQEKAMSIIFLVTTFISFIVISLWGLVISHKVAGPIHKLCQHLKRGDKNQITFRTYDFFQNLADDFNLYIEKNKGD